MSWREGFRQASPGNALSSVTVGLGEQKGLMKGTKKVRRENDKVSHMLIKRPSHMCQAMISERLCRANSGSDPDLAAERSDQAER